MYLQFKSGTWLYKLQQQEKRLKSHVIKYVSGALLMSSTKIKEIQKWSVILYWTLYNMHMVSMVNAVIGAGFGKTPQQSTSPYQVF